MAKSSKAGKQPAKTHPVAGAKSRLVSRAPAGVRAVAERSRHGWANDLVFDVREPKLAVSLRLDADVLRFFRGFGAGYQTRINEVLKAFMHARGGVEASSVMPPARPKHASSGNGKRVS